MKYWMYVGGDASPADLNALKSAGFSGVIGPARLAAPALEAGLEVILCGGAFPAGETQSEEHLAVDVNGKRQLWFHSCCPNHLATRQSNLSLYRAMSQTPGISGIFIDGARFSSPASSENPDSFFTCFCPRCRAEMARLGFDADRIFYSVRALYSWLFEGAPHPQDRTGLEEWLRFRAQTAGSHVKDFAEVVHSVPGLKAGAFFFAPSLARWVGQSYSGQSKTLDILSPMLYPAYPTAPGDPGTACLNRELAAMGRMLCQNGAVKEADALQLLSGIMGGAELPPLSTLAQEVPRSLICSETRLAIEQSAPAQVLPILQLDDPKLSESVGQAINGGAREIAFFAYRSEAFRQMEPLP